MQKKSVSVILTRPKFSEIIKPWFRHDTTVNANLYAGHIIFLFRCYEFSMTRATYLYLTSPHSRPLKISHILLTYFDTFKFLHSPNFLSIPSAHEENYH